MHQQRIQNRIRALIEKYERLSPDQVGKYNEANTRKDFILPLFQILGWDIHNTKANEVLEEEKASGKRVDYAFKIDGITKFYLEAKKFSVNLEEEKWARQAIWYAWHKSVPWVILTNFQSIKIYNAEWNEPNTEQSLCLEIEYKNFLKDLERLFLLSKESFKREALDKEALKYGHKPKRIPVDKQLASDLIRWRELLHKEFENYNPRVSKEKISEAVQTILNRLIFIKTTEDRKIEEIILQARARTWRDSKKTKAGNLVKDLNSLFRRFDKDYNSKLFEPHFCEKLKVDDNIFVDVINELYKNQKGIRYNFADIDADVFGSIYEQYLGHIQQTNGETKSKRKSQGIYYTPRYIVDYIVKNTLGRMLQERTPEEIRNIKILDPACGSGSFLIKAFEELISYWQAQQDKKIKYDYDPRLRQFEKSAKKQPLSSAAKMQLLRSNIYGVDLDKEAVEIAQLNLLIRILEGRKCLPNLYHQIAWGNSLISGTPNELKKYFGKNWKDKKPFNWETEFQEVFNQGGFDIIIGNPPYIDSEELTKKDKKFRTYCVDKYESAKGNWDIFCLFIQKGLDLLRDNGYFGMIVPNKLLSADYTSAIRNIIKRYSIISINDYSGIKVFGANVYPIVIIIQKTRPDVNHKIIVNSLQEDADKIELKTSREISQMHLVKYRNSWSPLLQEVGKINFIDKIIQKSKPLGDICNIRGAATVGEAYEVKKIIRNYSQEKNYFKFLNTGTIDRYIVLWERKKTQYIKSSYRKPIVLRKQLKSLLPKRFQDSLNNKIIIAGMTKKLECVLDEKGEYSAGKSTTIVHSKKINLKIILAILNSKLLTFIYRNIFGSLSLQGGYLRVGTPQIKRLPIIIPPEDKAKAIIRLVDKILRLNQELQKLDPIMDERECEEKKKEIREVDKIIDQNVYELYGLTEREIKIIEEFFANQ